MARNKLGLAGVVLASLLFLSGCFTTTLWEAEEIEPRHNAVSHRILLTPFTLLLDLLTWPFQEAFWEDEC